MIRRPLTYMGDRDSLVRAIITGFTFLLLDPTTAQGILLTWEIRVYVCLTRSGPCRMSAILADFGINPDTLTKN